MEAPVVAIVDQPEAADVDGIIDDLMAFNRIHAPALEQLRIVSLARVGERVVGGAIVFEYGGWAELAVLWVDEQQRGHGLGSRLVGVIEDDLRRRGFAGMHTDTFSFQALPFYEKLGFHVFGRIEGFVDGNTRYYLKKAYR
ncbi:MAG: GNAT family N-acetyltransferase [Alphaproteobacteria bacterium]|nr:GNAT family N-acetyltransferase [Alphaproteobacteria bacterium]